LDGAIADLTKAIELKPDFADAYNNRGIAKHAKGEGWPTGDSRRTKLLDGAIADLTKAIKLKPSLVSHPW